MAIIVCGPVCVRFKRKYQNQRPIWCWILHGTRLMCEHICLLFLAVSDAWKGRPGRRRLSVFAKCVLHIYAHLGGIREMLKLWRTSHKRIFHPYASYMPSHKICTEWNLIGGNFIPDWFEAITGNLCGTIFGNESRFPLPRRSNYYGNDFPPLLRTRSTVPSVIFTRRHRVVIFARSESFKQLALGTPGASHSQIPNHAHSRTQNRAFWIRLVQFLAIRDGWIRWKVP